MFLGAGRASRLLHYLLVGLSVTSTTEGYSWSFANVLLAPAKHRMWGVSLSLRVV